MLLSSLIANHIPTKSARENHNSFIAPSHFHQILLFFTPLSVDIVKILSIVIYIDFIPQKPPPGGFRSSYSNWIKIRKDENEYESTVN